MTSELRTHFGAPKDAGVLVSSVDETSPAGKAGVKVGDIVVAIDGVDVASPTALRRTLRDKKNGDTARLDILRGRNRQTLVASLVEREGRPLGIPGARVLRGRNPEEWRAFAVNAGDCGDLSIKIKDLEKKLKELEVKIK